MKKNITVLFAFMFVLLLVGGTVYALPTVDDDFDVELAEEGPISVGESVEVLISNVTIGGMPANAHLNVTIESSLDGVVFSGDREFVDGSPNFQIITNPLNEGMHELTATIGGTEGINTVSVEVVMPSDPAPEPDPIPEIDPVIAITDGDEDRVYFPGDILKFEVSGFPAEFEEDLSLAFVVFTDGQEYTNADVLAGLTFDNEGGFYYMTSSPVEGRFVFEGVIQEGLPAGAVGIMPYNPEETPRAANPIPLIEGNVADTMDRLGAGEVATSEFVLVGIDIPSEFEDISSNLADVNNLYNTDIKVVFEKEGMGSITFDEGLNIIENHEQLENLQNFLSINYDEESNEMVAFVDTNALQFLAAHSATIQFFNMASQIGVENIDAENLDQYIQISIFVDGRPVEDFSAYFDWENVTYDEAQDILTLPVNHFTEYRVAEAEEAEVGNGEEESEAEEGELPLTDSSLPHLVLTALLMLAGGFFIRFRSCSI